MPLAELLIPLIMLALVFASGFFSGTETALFSLTGVQRQRLMRSDTVAAGAIRTLLAETRALLITILLGNMVVNVLYFVLGTLLLMRLQRYESIPPFVIVLLSPLPLLVVVLFGEVMPKLVASRRAMTWATVVALPMLFVHRTLGPIRVVLNAVIITPLARLVSPRREAEPVSAGELQSLLEHSQRRGVIDHHEEELLQQALSLSELRVRDIMTPRVDIKGFNLEDAPEQLIAQLKSTRLSNVPVFEGDLDHIRGVVLSRQVLLKRPTTPEETLSLVREVSYVPEQQRVDQLLVHFRRRGAKLAIVVDEYGGTAGLVTLEDVVEQIVGEIAGPYETAGPEVVAVDEGTWRVSADLMVQELAERFGRQMREVPGAEHISTVGGLVMALLGRIPRVGDQVSIGNVAITVVAMNKRRIGQLRIHLANDNRDDSPSGGDA